MKTHVVCTYLNTLGAQLQILREADGQALAGHGCDVVCSRRWAHSKCQAGVACLLAVAASFVCRPSCGGCKARPTPAEMSQCEQGEWAEKRRRVVTRARVVCWYYGEVV